MKRIILLLAATLGLASVVDATDWKVYRDDATGEGKHRNWDDCVKCPKLDSI